MTSLDFLYIALGGGFMILVIFICVLLLHVTLILRDITKITANAKAVSDKVRETVLEPFKAFSEMTSGIGFVQKIIKKVQAKVAEWEKDECDENCECDFCVESDSSDDKNKKNTKSSNSRGVKRGIFSIKKFGK